MTSGSRNTDQNNAGDLCQKQRILLFGRTGSGKSTLANVLFNWSSESCPEKFKTCEGIRGQTIDIQREENDTMIIVDTVGFGETEDGSVSHEDAKNVLYDFFLKTRGEKYNYIAYVQKWGKVDLLDQVLWKFFKLAFSGSETNFILIFTHSKPANLENNRDIIAEEFRPCPCARWISVDFPSFPPEIDDNASETDRKSFVMQKRIVSRKREESFVRLRTGLADNVSNPVLPQVTQKLSKGRVLLIGRYPETKQTIFSLLTNGSSSFSAKDVGVTDPANPSPVSYEEAEGRGWEVVNARAFESYRDTVSERSPKEGAMLMLQSIFSAIMHGQYSHIVYVVDMKSDVKSTRAEKLVWQAMRILLSGNLVEKYLVALFANVSGKPVEQDEKVNFKLATDFHACKSIIYLDFPRNEGSSRYSPVPGHASRENSSKHSLEALEKALIASSGERISFEQSDLDEEKILDFLEKNLVGSPSLKFKWFQQFDPLTSLSRIYKDIRKGTRAETIASLMLPRIRRSQTIRSQYNCTFQTVTGYSHMTHVYLQLQSELEEVKSITVEAHSHDQGWTDKHREDHGTRRRFSTWGELGISHNITLKTSGKSQLISKTAKRLEVYINLFATDEWQYHVVRLNRAKYEKNSEVAQFMDNIKKGDTVVLYLRSQAGWANFAKFGALVLSSESDLLDLDWKSDF